jgi:signal transduction histidine kinase
VQLRSASEQTADFLAITAHELHSPVTAMTGGAELLAEHWPDLGDAERAETLRNLASSAHRTRRLLDELLMASRLEAGQLEVAVEPVSLPTVIAEAVAAADEPVTVGDLDDVVVAADRMRVAQVLGNLLANAARYGRPPITVDARTSSDAVEIRVCDAGAGIAAELEPKLFKKFIRGAGRRDRGTGLGLFIVRELARRQGGDAWYERGADGRPCFCFTLPRTDVKNR